MAFNLTFLPRSLQEISDAIEWYERRQEGLGEKFFAEVENELRRIVEVPFLHPKSDEADYRRTIVKKYLFLINFSSTKDEL